MQMFQSSFQFLKADRKYLVSVFPDVPPTRQSWFSNLTEMKREFRLHGAGLKFDQKRNEQLFGYTRSLFATPTIWSNLAISLDLHIKGWGFWCRLNRDVVL
jgi:hypothetical protein